MLDDQGLVPFSGLDENAAQAAHPILILARRRIRERRLERRELGNDLLDDGDIVL